MSLCNNQQTFNHAFHKAVEASRKKDEKNLKAPLKLYLLLHFIFMVWGLVIAAGMPAKTRVLHMTLAIVFGPAYVLANYGSQMVA